MKKPKKGALMTAVGVIGGAIAGKMAMNLIPVDDDRIKAAIPLVAGFFLAGQKNDIAKGAGYGMMATGGMSLAAAFIPQIGEAIGEPIGAPTLEDDETIFLNGAEEDENYMINAPADQSILSSPADQSILSAAAPGGFSDFED
jgi:hypothetical protein